jgi:hypothetical protein
MATVLDKPRVATSRRGAAKTKGADPVRQLARELAEKDSELHQHVIAVPPLRMGRLSIPIIGTAPLMQARFSAKTMQALADRMREGETARKGKARKPRDFESDYHEAMHISREGWHGIPAASFRNACISACRIVGFKMTLAKLSIFIEADGYDAKDSTPLVRITHGLPQRSEMMVRNATGVVDIRVRPVFPEWGAKVRIKFDSGQFTQEDVVNLLYRAGAQVGIGEGRPDSKSSSGMGYGTFELIP